MTKGAPSTAALKRKYGRTRLGIEQRFHEQMNAEVALAKLAQAVDDLVVRVAEPFQQQSDFSLVALGGYGRREMYPHSDVDLLILFQEAQREGVERTVTRMLHQLWDLELDLGHQVWSIDQLERSLEPIEFGLALLDARLLTNGRGPGQTLLDSLLPRSSWSERIQIGREDYFVRRRKTSELPRHHLPVGARSETGTRGAERLPDGRVATAVGRHSPLPDPEPGSGYISAAVGIKTGLDTGYRTRWLKPYMVRRAKTVLVSKP